MNSRTLFSTALAIGGALAFGSCGSSPTTSPTPPTTQPAPAPSPTPTPPSGSGPQPKSCGTGAPTGGTSCGYRPDPQLATVLTQSLDEVRSQKDIFYPDRQTIRYIDKFRAALVTALDNRGICGIFDFGNGIADNIYLRTADGRISEGYDVISGDGRGRVGYQNSCEPAGPGPDPKPTYPSIDGSCGLSGSANSFCVGQNFESAYAGDVRAALVELIAERPELFDTKDALNADLSYRLTDTKAYVAAMVAKVRGKGYCAMEEEELSVKKDNSMSENFDIVRTPGDRPDQYSLFVYKGRCHNAAF